MTTSYCATKTYTGTAHEIQAALRYAMRRIARRHVVWTESLITFSMPPSWTSWGEKVQVRIESASVTVSSKCRLPFQLHDGGKNEYNVQAMLDWMDEYFELWRANATLPPIARADDRDVHED